MSSANNKPWLDSNGKLVKGWKKIKADYETAESIGGAAVKEIDIPPRRRFFRA